MAQIDSSSSGVVLSAEELAEGIDQSSPDWRMAYAIADAELADRRGHKQVQQRAAFWARMRERRRATTRFVMLAGVLSATALGTAVLMLEGIYWALS